MNHVIGSSQGNLQSSPRLGKSAAVGLAQLAIRTCEHIKDSGAFCQAAAVGGQAYCRAHLSIRLRRRKMARARRRAGFLKLPPPEDMEALQVGAVRVRVALEAGRIDPGCAGLLRWAMRMSTTNLRFLQQQQGHLLGSLPNDGKGLGRSATSKTKSKRLYQMQINHAESMGYDNNTS